MGINEQGQLLLRLLVRDAVAGWRSPVILISSVSLHLKWSFRGPSGSQMVISICTAQRRAPDIHTLLSALRWTLNTIRLSQSSPTVVWARPPVAARLHSLALLPVHQNTSALFPLGSYLFQC